MTTVISVLGSTGVIGTKTLEVLSLLGDDYRVSALTAGQNADLLAQQIRSFRPDYVSVQDEATRVKLVEAIRDLPNKPDIGVGQEGLNQAAKIPSDTVVTAIVGARGLIPTWHAISRGANIALANKETLVTAGDLVMPKAARHDVAILPVDSEHSAILQALQGNSADEVEQYILTASGGPFRTWSAADMARVTVADALKHPNWTMGQKITIDSATMMNKGLEVIEAHHLFQAPYDRIKVVIHPQSIIHSMVAYQDGSVMAQMATADMRLPIQYALTYPRRMVSPWPRLDLLSGPPLTFEEPDFVKFPSLRLAYEAGRAGGYAPCVLNAANEVAVGHFLQKRISFSAMAKLVEHVLELHTPGTPQELNDVVEMDGWARRQAESMIEKGGWGG